jgi:hypothetical protein
LALTVALKAFNQRAAKMPNQRARNKKHIAAFVDAELYEDVKRTAKARGLTVTGLIAAVIEEAVADAKARQTLPPNGS